MNKRNLMIYSLIFAAILGIGLGSSNYEFQVELIEAGEWTSLGPVEFLPAATVTQYIDATQTTTYGTITNGPPNGMGNSASGPTDDTSLEEEGYTAGGTPVLLEYAPLTSSFPTGWTYGNWGVSGAYSYSQNGELGFLITKNYDLSSYIKVRINCQYAALSTSYPLEAGDWRLQIDVGSGYTTDYLFPARSVTTFVTIPNQDTTTSSSTVKWRWFGNFVADQTENIKIKVCYVYGIPAVTHYRFSAVFRFDSVTTGLNNYQLYVDFYIAGNDGSGLDFKIGAGDTTPDNLIASNKNDDFNVDVSSYITGSTVYLSMIDLTTGDGGQSTWNIQRVYFLTSNTVPVNSEEPVCINLDDGDNLYAQYKEYIFTSNVTDDDGFEDLDYVTLSFMNGTTPFWTVKFDEDTSTFSESLDANNMITLESTSSNVSSGIYLNITWAITIHWNHTDVIDYDLKQYVIDVDGTSDTDTYAVIDYDIETRLDFSSFSLSDGSGTVDRGSYNTLDGITASGTIIYYGSVDNYPPTDEVDVWISCADVAGSPWSDLTLTSGAFSMTVDSDDIVGLDTYTFKVVEEGTGSGGTNQLYTTHTTTYIADRVQVQSYSSSDSRININEESLNTVTLWYDYDNTLVTDGTVVVSGVSATYSGANGIWDFGETKSSVIGVTYNSVGVTGNTHGITTEDQNGQSLLQIWDEIEVFYSTISDSRTNYGEQEYPYFRLRLKYDNHLLDDGTNDAVNINSSLATWSGSGATGGWYKYYTQSSVGTWNFVVTSASESTYGITTLDSTSAITYDKDIIWDCVQVSTTTASDNRDNINDNVNIDFTLIYDYDNAQLTDGTITINGYSASHIGSGVWRITRTSASATSITYNTVVASGNTYGITVVDMNGQSETVIWDSLSITITGPTDNRQNLDANATGISFSAVYDYDGGTFDGTFTLNNTDYDGDSTVTIWYYTVQSVSGDTYGITAISSNDNTYMIWDSITITIFGPTDNRQDLNANATGIYATAVYDYDGASFNGTFTFNNTDWNGDGTVVRWDYTVSSVTGGTYGITTIGTNDDTYMIWDRMNLNVTSNPYWTIIGYNVTLSCTGTYEYDGSAWSGTFSTSNATGGTLYPVYSSVGLRNFVVSSATDNTYGLTEFTTDSVSCIWDDVEYSSLAYSWFQQDVNNVWLIVVSGTWTWEINATTLNTGADGSCILQSYMNATGSMATDDWAIVSTTGTLGDLIIGSFGTNAYNANITINCETTVNGITYDFQVWNIVIDVDILHSIHIENFNLEPTAEWFWVSYQTNWNNATIMIWDDAIDSGTTYIDSILNGTLGLEGMYFWDRSGIIGTHNVTILINGSATALSEMNKNFVDSNNWVFYNFSYTVSAPVLSISDTVYTSNDNYNYLSGITNVGSVTWTAYNNDTQMNTGGPLSAGSFQVNWLKNVTVGVYEWGVKFIDGTTTRWVNGTFEVSADVPVVLLIQDVVYSTSDDYLYLSGYANLAVTIWNAYNNETLINTGSFPAGSFEISWLKNTTVGVYEWGVSFTDGTTTRWVNGSYQVDAASLIISDTGFDFTDAYAIVRGTPNMDGTSTLYHNNGIVSGGGSYYENTAFVIFWVRDSTVGTHNISLKCVSGSDTQWVNGSYYVGPSITDDLAITGMSYSDAGTNLTFYWGTNWFNTTGQFYFDNVAKGSAVNEASTLSFTAPVGEGDYNISIRIFGGGTNILWINHTYSVAPNPMYLETWGVDVNGDTVLAFAETNWNNATLQLWEGTSMKDSGTEGDLLSYTKTAVVGDYSVGLRIDGGGGNVLWVNSSYSVVANPMYLLTWGISTTGGTITAFAETNWQNATLTLREDVTTKDSGAEGLVLVFIKNTTPGDYNISLEIDGGGTTLWINSSYTVDAPDPMYLTAISISITGNTVTGFAETNWQNATLTLRENDSIEDSGAEGTLLSYLKNTAPGDYTVSLEITSGASTLWYNSSYTIEEPDPMYLLSVTLSTTGPIITGFAETNWGNATLTIYENNSPEDTSSEGTTLFYLRNSVAGDYNVSLEVTSGATTLWFNSSYSVAVAEPMYLSTVSISTTGSIITGYAETNWQNATITLYENDSVEDTGSEGTLLSYGKNVAVGEYNVSLEITSGTATLWFNVSYTIAAPDPMYLFSVVVSTTGPIITGYAETNWGNATLTLYENNAQEDTGAEGITLFYLRNSVVGNYNVSLKISSGASVLWFNSSYTVEGPDAMYLLTASIYTTGSIVAGYAETNWHNATITIYENNSPKDSEAEGITVLYTKNTVVGNYNVSLEITSGSTTLWFNSSYSITSIDSAFYIIDQDWYLTDNWVTLNVRTSWDNATYYVWDNITGSPAYVGASFEGVYQFAISTVVGQHDFIVLVNGSQSTIDVTHQVATGSDTSQWEYIEYTYTVNSVTFAITEPFMMQNNESVMLGGRFYSSELMINYTVYDNGIYYMIGNITIPESGSYYAIYWDKVSDTTTANFTIVFQGGGSNVTFYGYYLKMEGNTYLSTGLYQHSETFNEEYNTYVDDSWEDAFISAVAIIVGVTAFGAGWWTYKRYQNRPGGIDRRHDSIVVRNGNGHNKGKKGKRKIEKRYA